MRDYADAQAAVSAQEREKADRLRAELRNVLEFGVEIYPGHNWPNMIALSTAISLKRIADYLIFEQGGVK